MNGIKAIDFLLKKKNFNTVLDIGSGAGKQAKEFEKNNKVVTAVDLGKSKYYESNSFSIVKSNFFDYSIDNKFDLVWGSHILEHQLNVGSFIKKAYQHVNEKGILAITVPPLKPNIVGGHLTFWNMGLLFYNLIINGIDCSEAHGLKYGYNISVVVDINKEKTIDIESLNLSYDVGDIEKLSPYFPFEAKQGFDGNHISVNWR